MRNVISFLTGAPKENIDSKALKSIVIDIVTIGLGTVILLSSIFDYRVKQDGVILGSSLFILGVLIRSWKKTLNKD
jgi:hypothetical protein